MCPYRIVFSDLDGTLLDRNGQVSEATATKIRALSAAGIPFVPVSARMPDAIYPIMERIGLVSPLVCYSGAWILGEDRRSLHSVWPRIPSHPSWKRSPGVFPARAPASTRAIAGL